jgi:hypothetical protein
MHRCITPTKPSRNPTKTAEAKNQSGLPTVTRLLDLLTSAMANKAPMSRAARSITCTPNESAPPGLRTVSACGGRAHVWQSDSIGAG